MRAEERCKDCGANLEEWRFVIPGAENYCGECWFIKLQMATESYNPDEYLLAKQLIREASYKED